MVSRDELVRTCWDGRIVGDDSISRVIGRLRRLAEDLGENAFEFETVPKVGYRLVGKVSADEPDAAPGAVDEPPMPTARPAPYRRPMVIAAVAALLVATVAIVGDDVPRWLAARAAIIARCGMAPAGVYGRPLRDEAMTVLLAECDAESEEQFDRALDRARRLTQVQPDLVTGWSAIAYFASGLARRGPPDRAAPLMREADAALARALAIDPADSRAWHVKVYQVPPADLVATDRAFQRALKARLSLCACVFQDYANFLRGVGRARDARQMLERAQDVIPLQIGPRAGLIQLDAADGRLVVARKELAEVDALGLDPVRSAQLFVSSSLWLKDYGGALAAMQQQPASGPQAFSDAVSAGFKALQGSDSTARAAASRQLAATAATCGCTNSFTIRMQAALGDAPGALAQIETQVAAGKIAPMLSTIGWDPVLAEVRRLPGFAPLSERVGLLRYWRGTRTRPDFCAGKEPPPVCTMI